jgi:MFS family permease
VTLLFEYSTPNNRTIVISWFNFASVLGAALGAIISGFIFVFFQGIFSNPFKMMFLISGLFRTVCFLVFFNLIKDVREFKKIRADKIILRVYRILPAGGIHSIPTSFGYIQRGIKKIIKLIKKENKIKIQ